MRYLICLALIALTACHEGRVEVVKPPVSLTTCEDEPTAPILLPVPWDTPQARAVQLERDKATVDYILSLRSAYGSCKGVVAGVKAWGEGL